MKFNKISLLIFSVFFLSACKLKPAAVSPKSEIVIGTLCTVNAYDDGTEELYSALFNELHHIDEMFSLTREDSELVRVNANAGVTETEVSQEVYNLVEKSLYYARKSNGAFNPAIGPLVKLWDINSGKKYVPSEDEIQKALNKINYEKILLRSENEKYYIFLEEEGMSLELGAIAKGYAADRLVEILKNSKAKRAVIDLGGNIFVYGNKPDGSKWKVGVKDPNEKSGTAYTLSVPADSSVVTSGVYERYFIKDEIRYHHIFDGKTGYPSEGGKNSFYDDPCVSVTIISGSSELADALSTTAFILGPDAFENLVKDCNLKDQVSAVYVSKEGNIIVVGNDVTISLNNPYYCIKSFNLIK